MIKTKEGNVEIIGIGAEILADLSVIVSTLKKRAFMSDDLILQAVVTGLNNDNEEISPEQKQEVESWLKAQREKVLGGMKHGN